MCLVFASLNSSSSELIDTLWNVNINKDGKAVKTTPN